jgi:hypothetical protein
MLYFSYGDFVYSTASKIELVVRGSYHIAHDPPPEGMGHD